MFFLSLSKVREVTRAFLYCRSDEQGGAATPGAMVRTLRMQDFVEVRTYDEP